MFDQEMASQINVGSQKPELDSSETSSVRTTQHGSIAMFIHARRWFEYAAVKQLICSCHSSPALLINVQDRGTATV